MPTLVNNPGSNNPLTAGETTVAGVSTNNAYRPNDGLFANIAVLVNPQMVKDSGVKRAITEDAMKSRVIDMPQSLNVMKTVKLNLTSNGALLLSLNDGKQLYNHPVTSSERKQLNNIMNDPNLTDDMKVAKLQSMMSNIGMSVKLSNNFEQNYQQSQSTSASMHR